MSYSTAQGRFLETDPMEYVDGPNMYQFESSNPVNHLDPTGLYDTGGHFWTVYIVAIAAGKPPIVAEKLAYYAQYPDQFENTDAAWLYTHDITKKGATDSNPNYQWNHDVYEILHSLHGGGPDEIAKRRKCLQKMLQNGQLSAWEQGFVAHALGDAYAHTYDDAAGNEQAYGYPDGHLKHGHTPDLIASGPQTYGNYVDSLFLSLGGNMSNAAQVAMINRLKGAAAGLPKDVGKEASAMEGMARGAPFGYTGSYVPGGNHNRSDKWPLNKEPTLAEINALIQKIKKACDCK